LVTLGKRVRKVLALIGKVGKVKLLPKKKGKKGGKKKTGRLKKRKKKGGKKTPKSWV